MVDEVEAWEMGTKVGMLEEGRASPLITTVNDSMSWDMEKQRHRRTLTYTVQPVEGSFAAELTVNPK